MVETATLLPLRLRLPLPFVPLPFVTFVVDSGSRRHGCANRSQYSS